MKVAKIHRQIYERSKIKATSCLLITMILTSQFTGVARGEVDGIYDSVKKLPKIIETVEETAAKIEETQEEIDQLERYTYEKILLFSEIAKTQAESLKAISGSHKRLRNAVTSQAKAIEEQYKVAETQIDLAKKQAKETIAAKEELEREINRLRLSEVKTRQAMEEWKLLGLVVLKILSCLIVLGYLVGIISRLFMRFRGVVLDKFPLVLPSELNRKNEKMLTEIPQNERLLQVEENQSILRAGDEPFHFFGPGFRRFPKQAEITRVNWKGMFFYRLRRRRWWAWRFTGTAELGSDDPIEVPMIIRLRDGQDLFLNPDFLIGHDERVVIRAHRCPRRLLRFFTGQPLKCMRATGPGRILLAASGGLKHDRIFDERNEKPIPSALIVAWTGSANLDHVAVSSSKSEAFGNWIIDAVQNLPLLSLVPFVKLDSIFANLLRPFIPPQPEDLIQVRFRADQGLRGEVILARTLARHVPASSFSAERRQSAPLVNITIVGA